jgi:serine/threonine-protein kinase
LGYFSAFETVAFAHAQSVVHRDLKPSNIMVGTFGEVQVIDWGLAKYLSEIDPQSEQTSNYADVENHRAVTDTEEPIVRTVPGLPIGTPAYMSPEQARGELDRIDKRADVFALGAILCEILTGKPPYLGTRAEVEAQAKAGSVGVALDRLRALPLNPRLVYLMEQCLAPDRAERPADAGALNSCN